MVNGTLYTIELRLRLERFSPPASLELETASSSGHANLLSYLTSAMILETISN